MDKTEFSLFHFSFSISFLAALLIVGGRAFAQAETNPLAQPAPAAAPNLPVVFLDAKEPITSEQRVACTVKLVSPKSAGSGETGPLAGVVRIHGATSQRLPKKSYTLSFDAPARLLDLRESGHWILNAAYIDRSLMRHKLSYDLFRSLSTNGAGRFAAASRFVEVHLNGSYNGVYLLMERVDRPLLGLRAYNTNDLNHACIYKAVNHAANFGRPGHAGYEQHSPDPTVQAYWAPLDQFNRFVSTAAETDFRQPQTGIGARLDLGNAIDFHLLLLVTSNGDGVTKNFFLARDGQAEGPCTQRFFFVPWDYDGSFGRNWAGGPYPATAWLSNHLLARLLAMPGYRERFVARWNYLRDHQFSVKTIHAMIEANVRTLGGAARHNFERWPTTDGFYPDRLAFEEDIAQMKSWTDAHLKWLDQEINRTFGKENRP
jgi:hypothetical protein